MRQEKKVSNDMPKNKENLLLKTFLKLKKILSLGSFDSSKVINPNVKLISSARAKVLFISWLLTIYMSFGSEIIPSFSVWYMRLLFFATSVVLFGGMNLIKDDVIKRKYRLSSLVIYIVASLLMLIFLPLYNLGLAKEYFLDQFVFLITILVYFGVKLYKFLKQK